MDDRIHLQFRDADGVGSGFICKEDLRTNASELSYTFDAFKVTCSACIAGFATAMRRGSSEKLRAPPGMKFPRRGRPPRKS